jgi:hypothetical protein
MDPTNLNPEALPAVPAAPAEAPATVPTAGAASSEPTAEEQLQAAQAEAERLKAELARKEEQLTRMASSSPDDLATKLASMEQKVEALATSNVTQAKEKMLDLLAGNDTSLKERLISAYNKFKDEPGTPAEVEARLKDAYMLAQGTPFVSPFMGASGSANYAPISTVPNQTRFADTPDGRALAEKLNIKFDN